MWLILHFLGEGQDGYYIRPSFKMAFFERIHEVNPYSGWGR